MHRPTNKRRQRLPSNRILGVRDIGGLVWIVFVLIAVVSSIARSARKARGGTRVSSSLSSQVNRSSETPTRTMQVAPRPPARMQQVASLMTQFAQEAQSHADLPPRPKPVPRPPPVAPVATPAPVAPVAAAPPFPQRRGIGFFADRGALVRGIVAAEVLGKPLALRDE